MQSNNSLGLQSLMKTVRENESLMKGYASKKCKSCFGRGYIEIVEPGDFFPSHYLCSCVENKVKKEFKS